MIKVTKLGERTVHPHDFEINRPNGHPVYLLILIQTKGLFLVNGEWITVEPDTAILFKPRQQHRYIACEEHYIDSWIHIDANNLLLGDHFPYGEPISLHDPEIYHDLFHVIFNEFFGTSAHREVILNDLVTSLLYKLMAENETSQLSDIYYSLVNLRKRIYAEPNYHWTTENMAKEVNVSVGYLQKMYKRFFGISCINDVIRNRIEAACEMLIASSTSIEKIAESCGYNNTEHFIRQFKSIMNITPHKFRLSQSMDK